jgi:16S rRNA (cytidine1402-2'-O)-methyltransferase
LKPHDHKVRTPKAAIGNQTCGTLYLVSTPIGNLEDITLRALRILKEAELIAAENTSRTKVLCRHYGIHTKLTAYNQHNQKVKAPELVRALTSGRSICVVTDAGTPGISDPGSYLVGLAIDENIPVTPIPGPSALLAALTVSGFPTDRFVFLGFLSSKSGRRKKELKKLISEPRTMVFFEAPHRIRAMLTDLRAILGDRAVALTREMTKVFEETRRGSVSAILDDLAPDKIRGEFTLVVAGAERKGEDEGLSQEVAVRIEALLEGDGMTIRDVADLVAREEGVAYRTVYRACLARKRARQDNQTQEGSESSATWNRS